MPTTMLDMRNMVRSSLASSSDWADAVLDRWIRDGIRMYSAQFPRRLRYTLTLTTGTQAYALPGGMDLIGILSVEYPTGESPQSWIQQVDEWSDAFQNGDEVYCVRGVADSTAIDTEASQELIVFAETVATGEYAAIEYLGMHTLPDIGDNDAIVSVPQRHHDAIYAYCQFRAMAELMNDEAVTVDTSNVSIVLSQLTDTTRSAWARYKDVMDRLEYLDSGHSKIIGWNTGRIY